tara:strand:+ start:746 stop:1096 length:351 start_codon:yes stop_codon:yes gene_type:complete
MRVDLVDAIIAISLSIIIVVSITGPSINHGVVNPFSCRETVGTVIAKDNTEGFVLWVELDYKDEVHGYRVFVSPAIYEDYEVGYSYTETTCDLLEYEEIGEIINSLAEAGLLEGIG